MSEAMTISNEINSVNAVNITVKTPPSFDPAVCKTLEDKAERFYSLHGNKLQITNLPVVLFAEFEAKIKEGFRYEVTNSSAFTSPSGAITVTLIKPDHLQQAEIAEVKAKAKADYEAALSTEKQRQIELLAEQQYQTYLRKEEEKRLKKEQEMRAKFLSDAESCFSKIKTNP